jgi:predicted nucleic acid-binding protein
MLFVDTNVVVYLMLEGKHNADARRLFEFDSDWQSEEFLLVEFSNVLSTATRLGRMQNHEAMGVLTDLASLMAERLHRVPHSDALAIANHFRVSAYDARFLALAESMEQKLVTEDARLRAAVPSLTQSIAEALAGP